MKGANKMNVYKIWKITPESHIYIMDGEKRGFYYGQEYGKEMRVVKMRAAKYPMYSSVIEIWTEE